MIHTFLMLGTIFNLAKVNTLWVPCMWTATLSLSLTVSIWLASYLAYIEKITDAYSQSKWVVLKMERISKTINSVNNINCDNFLSYSAWSSIMPIISAESTADDHILNAVLYPSSREAASKCLTKLLTSTCTFLFHNFSSHYFVGIR